MLIPSLISSLQPLRATAYKAVTFAELSNKIQVYSQQRFTGRLDLTLENTQEQQWQLYFSRGSLIWASSKLHTIRRWCRQLSRHCSQLLVTQEWNPPYIPDYDSLAMLVRPGKIRPEDFEAVIEGLILEILFDIIQWGETLRYRGAGQLIYREITLNTVNTQLVVTCTDQAWRESLKFWEAWQRADLAALSPNQAPVILNAQELQRQTSPLAYQNLTTWADGKHTFRDLAVKLNRNLLLLTQPIMPLIRKRLIGLREIEDLSYSIKPFQAATPTTREGESGRVREVSTLVRANPTPQHPSTTRFRPATPTPSQQAGNPQVATPSLTQTSTPSHTSVPLVAYIDDSQTDSQTMNQILTEAGYQCINVQDPVQALPILLEKKPDLIFLDLVMPIANGYEICAQIRRISMFKDTPIIILTSNDGIVDRVRAKMVGSSGFLAKPINSDKVLNIVRMYLQKSASQSTPSSSHTLTMAQT
jgi:two-component system, chemotaxis family, response regulator PixG